MKTHLRPVLMLAVLSPLTAEFLLGDQYLQGFLPISAQLGMLVAYVMFYGMAAVLIREIGRRLRVGWPGLLLLALGFGLVEEGLLTQSLFNPHYLGLSLTAPGHLGALGIGAPWTVFVLSLHVVWSMGSPIAIMEAWSGRGGRPNVEPWLGRAALIGCSVVFLVGAAAIAFFTAVGQQQPFRAAPAQMIGAAIAAGLAVAAGLSRRGRQLDRPAPVTADRAKVRIGGWAGFGLVATTTFQLCHQFLTDQWPWISTAAMVICWLVVLLIMNRLRPEPYAVAIGALATYGWVGVTNCLTVADRAARVSSLVEQTLLIMVIVALLGWTLHRIMRRPAAEAAAASLTAVGRPPRR